MFRRRKFHDSEKALDGTGAYFEAKLKFYYSNGIEGLEDYYNFYLAFEDDYVEYECNKR